MGVSGYPLVLDPAKVLAVEVIRVLQMYQPDWLSVPAVQIALGTCAAESLMGYYRKQVKGPARGIFQIEPTTAVDIFDRYIKNLYPKLYKIMLTDFFPDPDYAIAPLNVRKQIIGEALINGDALSILLCRAKYRSHKAPLDGTSLVGLASTWKTVYNTYLGKGTVEGFTKKYIKYVGDFDQTTLYIQEYVKA